jgi:hypothetical protein
MRTISIAAVVAGLWPVHGDVNAQQTLSGDAPPRKLAAAPLEFAESFSSVRGVRVLPDDRVIVTDGIDNAIYLVDFRAGTRTPLARTGNGPREYRRASLVHPAAGGGFLVADPILRRFLPIGNDGQVDDVVTYPTISREVGVSLSGPDLYTPDTLGNPFGNVYRAARTPGAANGDSLTLVRLDRTGGRIDTIARLGVPEARCVQPSPGVTNCRTVHYSPSDLWTVAPDGWVAVVRAIPYRVQWYPPRGAPVNGPLIRFTPIGVPAAEKDSIVEAAHNPRGPSVSMGGVKPGQRSTAPVPIRSGLEPIILDAKPAFGPYQLLLTDRAGRVWLQRHRPFGMKGGPVYDIVDRRGILVDRIELPPRTRLVGIDGPWLFVVRVDDDDLQYLQRFPMP